MPRLMHLECGFELIFRYAGVADALAVGFAEHFFFEVDHATE